MPQYRNIFILLCVTFGTLLPDARGDEAITAADAEGIAFFETHVRPLLVKHCYECHSADTNELKGGLGLDSRVAWLAGGDSGPAIVPGKPDESPLIEAVRYESYEMPPSGKLSDAEIAVLEKWVRMGAPDPRDGSAVPTRGATIDIDSARQFWSFQLPESHRPPVVRDAQWPKDELDYFILKPLEDREFEPAPDADREIWLRRVTFDLIGLPPTASELDNFLADSSAEAQQRVVDRLLASPQFGVHWGRHWLDVARHADSNGSDFNATFFNAWRYRNYVIDAFNNDKPYDRFIREQLAGDLLEASSDQQRAEQLIASTFLMVGAKMLSERDKEKLTMDVVDEQIDSVGKAFMGMTLGCARCHDHKFDPIPTDDYYALAGIFRSTITLEGESQQYVSTWVETPLPVPDDLARELERHKQQKDQLSGRLAESNKALKLAEEQLAHVGVSELGILVDDSDAEIVGNWKDSKYSSTYVGVGYLHDEKTGKGEKSITWRPAIPQDGEYEVRIAYAGANGRDSAVPVTIRYAGGVAELKLDQTQVPPINKLFKSLGTYRFEAGTTGSVVLANEGTTGFVIADAVQFIPVEETAVADGNAATAGQAKDAAGQEGEKPAESASEKLKQTVARLTEEVKRLEAEGKELDKNGPRVPTAMAAREAPQIGDCQICIRGEVSKRGPMIERGFLRAVSDGSVQIERKDESGRRELADWIARAEHPLTARVIVNRLWQHMLGEGLVRSVDNFGHLGDLPSHPELLDTLAVNLVESGWSMKAIIRRIALSRTYAMSTQYDPRAFEMDPDNRLLWRAHRKRLTAEQIRDAMLQVSGQLDFAPGESPVQGLGQLAVDNTNQASSGKTTEGAKRSIYLPIVRNELPTFLTVFDFADPDVVTGRRPETNIPAQALFLLNSPFVKQQATLTVDRLFAREDDPLAADPAARIDTIFRTVLGRSASSDETQRLIDYVQHSGGDSESGVAEAWGRAVQSLFASTEFRMLD